MHDLAGVMGRVIARMGIVDLNRRSAIFSFRIAALMAVLLLASSGVMADEPAAATNSEASSAASTSGETQAGRPADVESQQKKRRITAGMLTIALVMATGLTLLALVILGGVATRRTLRRPDEKEEPARGWAGGRIDVTDPEQDGVAGDSVEGEGEAPAPLPPDTQIPDGTRE